MQQEQRNLEQRWSFCSTSTTRCSTTTRSSLTCDSISSTTFGAECERALLGDFEELRDELGYADYLGALQRYRVEHPREPYCCCVLFLLDYPFASRLYPGALDVLAQLGSAGRRSILSDGDVVFQPRKIERSGLWDAVDGDVLIYIHKEQMLDDVEQRYPARALRDGRRQAAYPGAIKKVWGDA